MLGSKLVIINNRYAFATCKWEKNMCLCREDIDAHLLFVVLTTCYIALPTFLYAEKLNITQYNIHNLHIIYISEDLFCRHSGAGVNAVR
jgi:hypothetical protein